jgi:predicted RNA polymerase sigma factor
MRGLLNDATVSVRAKTLTVFGVMLVFNVMKMGRFTEAREEIQRAITMTQNLREQESLTERLKQIEKAPLSA